MRLALRCVGADSDGLLFRDRSRRRCDAVIWTMGYEDDTGRLDIDAAAAAGAFVEERGVSPVPGLYHVGREWQTSRASGPVCGVDDDAQAVAGLVASYLRRERRG